MYTVNGIEFNEAWKSVTGELDVYEYLPEGQKIDSWEQMLSKHVMNNILDIDKDKKIIDILQMNVGPLEPLFVSEPQLFTAENGKDLVILLALRNVAKQTIEITTQKYYQEGSSVIFVQFAYSVKIENYNNEYLAENKIFDFLEVINVEFSKENFKLD